MPVQRACRGQVLPFGLVLLLGACASFYFMVNTARMVEEKIRTTNAADAAAYSAALMEARALNHHAYVNRAIVANQVAIAQTLAMVGWTGHFAETWTRKSPILDALNDLAPVRGGGDAWRRHGQLLAVVAGQHAADYYSGGQASQTVRDEVMPIVNEIGAIAVIGFDLASTALAATQPIIEAALRSGEGAGGSPQQRIVERVVHAMDPALRAEIVASTHGYPRFLTAYRDADRDRLRHVVLESRDPFSRERAWTLEGGLAGHRLERRGTTTMPDADRWTSFDELSFRKRRLTRFGWRTQTIDLAHSDVEAGADGGRSETRYTPEYRWPFDAARYSGLPTTFDVPDDVAEPRTGVAVRVTKPWRATLTSQNAARATSSGRLALFDTGDGALGALARAETTFERPQARADARHELGSTFNPYWHARLVAPTSADRRYARAQHRDLELP